MTEALQLRGRFAGVNLDELVDARVVRTWLYWGMFWLIVTPSLPEGAQAAAQAKGRERYETFIETLGRRLAKGQCFLREVSVDKQYDVPVPSKEPQQ